jgi:exonuclease SbcC
VRLNRLVLENFMPYRHVDLDFSRLGLFAIVGDTGAGKSALVDAICFALYDEIPRLRGKPRDELITKGANSYRVALSFSLAADEYEVIRQGRLGNPTQQFSLTKNGVRLPIVSKKEFDRILAQTLLMMSYEIFTQIIILPQGKFDRFLKPNQPRDRRDTLIELLGLKVYEEIGKKAGEHKVRWEAQRTVLERDLQGIDPQALTEEALASLTGEIETAQIGASQLAERLIALQREHDALEMLLRKHGQKAALEKDRLELQAQGPQMEKLEGRLRQAEALATLAPVFRQFEQARTEETKLTDQQAGTQVAVQAAQKNLQEAQGIRSELVRKKSERDFEGVQAVLERESTALAAWLPQATRLEGLRTQMEQARKTLVKLRGELDDCLKNSREAEKACQADGVVLVEAERRVAEGVQRQTERDFDGALTTIEKEYAHLSAWISAVTRLEGLRPQEEKLKASLKKLREQLQSHQDSIVRALSSQREAEKSLVRQTEAVQQAESIWRHAQEEHLALALQRDLQPGDPCPVCGASIQKLVPHREENLKAAEKDLQAVRSAQQEAERNVSLAQQAQAVLAAQEAGCQVQIEEGGKALFQVVAQQTDLRASLPEEIAAQERPHVWLQTRLASLEESRDRLRVEQRALEAELKQAQQWVDGARQRLAASQQNQAVLTAQEAAIRSRIKEGESGLAMLQGQLEEEKGKFRSDLADHPHPQAFLQDELNSLQKRRDASRKEQQQLNQALQAAQDRVEEVQKAFSAREQELAALTARLEQAQSSGAGLARQLEESAAAIGYGNWAEARQDLLDEASLRRERTRLKDHRTALDRVAGQIELLQVDLGERDPEQTRRSHEETGQTLRSGQEEQPRQNALLQQLNQKRNALLEQREFLHTRQEQLETAKKQQTVYAQLARDFSSKGMVNHVANHIIEELLEEANRHLRALSSGRYELELEQGEDRSEDRIVVLDGYTSAPPRDVSTLSGGETFLASLALALSVKVFLARTRQLGCFFIDEGFGTLDEHTVQEVGDVLEMLKREGSQVGIITHRHDLVERFEDVLEVTNEQGLASLSWRRAR